VITIRHLLTHTAGLSYGFLEPPNGPLAKARVSDGLDLSEITLEENLRRLAGVPLCYAPGTGWKYSLALDVLGAVVSKAGGGTLPQVVTRLITGPLGMKDTVFVVTQPERLAIPYIHGKGAPHRMAETEVMPFAGCSGIRFQPSRATDSHAFPSGGGGMCGTAADYIKFLEAVRRDGANILKPETVKAMTTNQISYLVSDLAGPGWGWGFGAAVLVDQQKSPHPGAPGTWGWSGVFGTSFFMDRASGLSVVVMTNTTPDGFFGPFPENVAKAVYGK
jgi:CubicO group peptidase (beta-lactamase class C family)